MSALSSPLPISAYNLYCFVSKMRGLALISFLLGLLIVLSTDPSPSSTPGGSIVSLTSKNRVLLKKGHFGSELYEFRAGSTYNDDKLPILLNLTSNPYQAGFDTGSMLAKEYHEGFVNLIESLFGEEWWEPLAARVLCKFLDSQYEKYLGVELSDEYKEEFRGLSDGGREAGYSGYMRDIGLIARRGQVLANIPSTLKDLKYVLMDEKKSQHLALTLDKEEEAFVAAMLPKWGMIPPGSKSQPRGFGCSMLGVWGSRTEGGKLFTGRNLDYMTDTGVAKNKLFLVHHPPAGIAHVEVGWAGLWGVLAGMSAAGLTVHEANLESNDLTFRGYGWILRMREVMSRAQSIDEAMEVWNSTGNTVGYNHGIGSGIKDGRMVVLETMAHHTAEFGDMDPREIAGGGTPRDDAVWRTNHGYDPYTIQHYMWNNTGAYQDSLLRYNLVPPMLDDYAAASQAIGVQEIVNMTAILGGKGTAGDQPFTCTMPFTNEADNILSVAFSPSDLKVYAAYESGTGDGWIPAACNSYVEVDMTEYF